MSAAQYDGQSIVFKDASGSAPQGSEVGYVSTFCVHTNVRELIILPYFSSRYHANITNGSASAISTDAAKTATSVRADTPRCGTSRRHRRR